METPQSATSSPSNVNQRTILIIVAAIVLCCGCLAVGALGLYGWFTIRDVQTQEFPTAEFPSVVTQEVMIVAPGSDPSEAPSGGLGNDSLRTDTWQAVAAAAVGQGCDQPIGEDSTIEVLAEPSASGTWVEKWTVACSAGDSYAFEVEYILDATGATFNIRSLP
jgi:hypothetical protein